MEKKPFKFGKGSFALILPKKWAERRRITYDSKLILDETDNGSLVISTNSVHRPQAEEIIDKLSDNELSRHIGFHYMYGTSTLRLYSKRSLSQKRIDFTQNWVKHNCIGFEVVSQAPMEIVIEDISSANEMTIEKILTRMRYIAGEAFANATSGSNQALANCEQLINRFYLFGVRALNATMPKNYYAYMRVLQLIEQVCDDLFLNSRTSKKVPVETIKKVKAQFEMSMEALSGEESAINRAIGLGEPMLEKIDAKKPATYSDMLFRDMVQSTIAIAETGIAFRKPSDSDSLL